MMGQWKMKYAWCSELILRNYIDNARSIIYKNNTSANSMGDKKLLRETSSEAQKHFLPLSSKSRDPFSPDTTVELGRTMPMRLNRQPAELKRRSPPPLLEDRDDLREESEGSEASESECDELQGTFSADV
eukprot:TRINITY_DN1077_c0_g1_i9.p3 TRINITY_DN1077_c0_g1~~TRINITY_DN1077_c0_g1_i9.p3  ORF type:complete len:130 (-),score=6.94 TRINITY_DN1077_c0_g1_i9:490-879(-)